MLEEFRLLSISRITRQARLSCLSLLALVSIASIHTSAQTAPSISAASGQIIGTVTDLRGDTVPGATVVLTRQDSPDRRTLGTDANGFFEFDNVQPGVSFHIVVSAVGFDDWKSPEIILSAGEVRPLVGIQLRITAQNTTVRVTYNPVEIATEQIHAEETQRIFGLIPNFYVSYDGDSAAPLTTKMKFKLAFKVSYDPVTIGGVAAMSGLRQATDTPDYQQGMKGYAQRFGAISADSFTDIMIGGAILPSLLHEDPRYFYQGTGTNKSRLWHAITSPFVTKRDNGSWGPNYASMGGDLASSGISTLYYPKSNRGVGFVFSQFAVGTAERVMASVAQEFLLSKFTHRGGHVKQDEATAMNGGPDPKR